MRYLTPDEVLAIQQVVIEETGGGTGVREAGLLESAALKPRAHFGGEDLYPDIFLKAAVLYEALINYHVFVDGNKRTGLAALAEFLRRNGYELTAPDLELERFTLQLATTHPDLAEVALWVRQHSRASEPHSPAR